MPLIEPKLVTFEFKAAKNKNTLIVKLFNL